ncbi:MAG TPA: transaldolase [Bacteroidota bacterium]|nr:transaldolase [Bacteroidota bacterium]
MNKVLKLLSDFGQSIWYDNISRALVTSGELKKLVDEGLLGMTSNPTIFDKAISGSADYDAQLRDVLKSKPGIGTAEIIQQLMVKDIQMAADVLRPAFDRSGGLDGYVSVEVSPSKARDTAATIAEVRQLVAMVDRKNLMVKIPATREGLPAITRSTADGYNINVTLIFSLQRYKEVADAFLAGLEIRVKEGRPIDQIASVASVFVSRIDTLVDGLLRKRIEEIEDPAAHSRLSDLQGKVAVANTKMIYQAFREIFESPRFAALKAKGARVQRPLWGSTGTKNPAYSDLLYVETLIGPHTVNTVPPATFAAIIDHCRPAYSLESDLEGARRVLRDLAASGIDIDAVTRKLEEDGVATFERSFDGLYKNLEAKKGTLKS